MTKVSLKPTPTMFPLVVMLVTSVVASGKLNLITLAWVGMVNSEPPMVSVSSRPSRYSHGMVKACREFVVNIPSEEMIREVDF